MDTGDVIYTAETEIGEFETSGELFDRLMVMGAELLHKTLTDIEAGTAPRTPQNHADASYVTMLDKSLSPIDWNKTPREIVKWVYGLQPWPVATMHLGSDTFKVYAAAYTETETDKAPGSIVSAGKWYRDRLRRRSNGVNHRATSPRQKRMKAADYLLGHPIKVED